MLADSDHLAIASALDRTSVAFVPADHLLASYGGVDIGDGMAVRRAGTLRELARGRRSAGYKIGLTGLEAQRALQAAEPAFGVVFGDSVHHNATALIASGYLWPRFEVEVAFVIKDDLMKPAATVADVLEATDYILPAIEIVDSRYGRRAKHVAELIMDNVHAADVVLGEGRADPRLLDLGATPIRLTVNDDVVEESTGSVVMGNPAVAVAWLIGALHQEGAGLVKGDIIFSGSCTVPRAAEPGDVISATIAGVGSVEVSFT